MSTFSAKPSEIDKKWILIDAKDLVVGRVASIIAMRLRGKHLPTFTPHMDMGDNVIVINADKVKLTGKKLDQRRFFWHTGHPGGIKDRTQRQLLEGRFPERVLENAVRRMIPGGPLGRKQYGNLRGLCRRRPSARGPAAREARCRLVQLQECEGQVMAETINSLEDLGTASGCRRRSRCSGACAEARRAGPRLRHRQAQERHRPRLDQAGYRQDHGQRQGLQRLLRPPGAADDPAAADRRCLRARTSTTSSPPFPAAVSPARPVRCVTASPRR